MKKHYSSILFIVSLLALYVFFNTCRRLLSSCAPSYLETKLFSQDTYGSITSITSILFGVSRFLSYYLMERFKLEKFLTAWTVILCCICVAMGLVPSMALPVDQSILLIVFFSMISIAVGFPFSCYSTIIREYVSPKYRSLLWSLLSVTSCLGSIVSTSLVYLSTSPEQVFKPVAQLGIACLVCFYVFFPENKVDAKSEADNKKKQMSVSKCRELMCIILSLVAHHLIYLTRRVISEWSSLYTQSLFSLSPTQTRTMFTYGSQLFEFASIISLLLFGVLSTRFAQWNMTYTISLYGSVATLTLLLPQFASFLKLHWLYYVGSFLSGFFLSVPYAMLELLIMTICSQHSVTRVLSIASLSSQVAAAVAGYPVSVFFNKLCSFKVAPVVESCVMLVAMTCLWTVYCVGPREEKSKVE